MIIDGVSKGQRWVIINDISKNRTRRDGSRVVGDGTVYEHIHSRIYTT